MESEGASGGAPVEKLAATHGGDAWRFALVAGADQGAATQAALHALVIGAVEGGQAAERPAILALARSWALSIAGQGPGPASTGPVAAAFWSLPEPVRSALWCTDVLGLPGRASTAAVARGRIRRAVCAAHRTAKAGTDCTATADVLGRVLADHAPATKKVLVSRHVAGCDGCARLLASLRDPAAAVAAELPPVPDLGLPARKAWRDHVGAPRRTKVEQVRRAASVLGDHRQPVAAVLALLTAGTFAAASSQLASSYEGPAGIPLAAPVLTAAAPVRPPVVVRRQAIIPPLSPEVAADPRFAAFVTPDLAVVTPVTAPPPAPPPPPPPPPPVPVGELISEPPPAVGDPTTVLDLPLPLPLAFSIELGPSCSSLNLGPLSLPLICES